MNNINKILKKGFSEPSTEIQFNACQNALEIYFNNISSNKTEFLIQLRDFINEYKND